MSTSEGRPAFDPVDAALAERYRASVNLSAFDPFADPDPAADLIFKTSLAGARLMMEHSFATATAGGRRFRGYPMWVERSSVNAFAIAREGLQICGVDVGLVNAAFELSLFVFSRSSLFREIGDPDIERSPALPEEAQLAFWISDRLRSGVADDGQPVGIELVPRDGSRELAAHFLTQLLLRFVWLHELYHCLNGHTGLIAAQGLGLALDKVVAAHAAGLVEAETPAQARERQVLFHGMEFDADRTACWTLIRMQQSDFEPLDGLAAWPRPLRLKLAMFAAMLMTFLFDQAARRQAGASGGKHPLAYHRLHTVVRTTASNLADDEGEIRQVFANVLSEMRTLGQCEPAFVSLDAAADPGSSLRAAAGAVRSGRRHPDRGPRSFLSLLLWHPLCLSHWTEPTGIKLPGGARSLADTLQVPVCASCSHWLLTRKRTFADGGS